LTATERRWSVGLAVVLMAAVLWPLVHDRDGFPLSNYPMFSQLREDPSGTVFHVVAFSSQGHHRPASPELVGTDEIMQAYQTVKFAVARGKAEVLCAAVAQRVFVSHGWEDVEQLEVRVDTFDTVAYWKGSRRPLHARIVARCSVPAPEGA
jgi:hypothetical protein